MHVPTDDCVGVGEPYCAAVRLNHTTSHRAATAAAVGVADDVRASAGLVTAPEVESDPTSVLSGHDMWVRFGVGQANNLPRQVYLIMLQHRTFVVAGGDQLDLPRVRFEPVQSAV